MKLSSLLLPAALVALTICSCDSEKPYTINGLLNIPSELPYGDTIIQIPSPNGSMVYLVDDDVVIDSCEVADNRFAFSGVIKPSEAYIAVLGNMYFTVPVVIEPGDIMVNADAMDAHATGTVSNDGINSLLSGIAGLDVYLESRVAAVQDSLDQLGVEMGIEHYSMFQEMLADRQSHLIDSVYEANKDNLAGVYAAVLGCSDEPTARDFEEAMSRYPARVRDNAFTQQVVNALKAQDSMFEGFGGDEMLFDDDEDEAEIAE